jgi:putative hydrolase of the HAD superfamily
MEIFADERLCVVLDLDDTLYKEIDFVKSALSTIIQTSFGGDSSGELLNLLINEVREKRSPIDYLVTRYPGICSVEHLVRTYREHVPAIFPLPGVRQFVLDVRKQGGKCGVITDGRVTTQMNKLRSLGLVDLFDRIVVSEQIGTEKPCMENYIPFEKAFPGFRFYYIGDNPKKDFIAPNKLGWGTVGLLDDGRNIHRQDCGIDASAAPKHWISDFREIIVC